MEAKLKAAAAMSGGVDSSVTAYLLKELGYEVGGITLKLFEDADSTAARDAADAAERLNISHRVLDLSADFEKEVITRFVQTYLSGKTPNPCVYCNRHIKFGSLADRALEAGFDYLATGHYAVCEYDASSGRYIIKKAADISKDQSYVLYSLTQRQLAHTLFPLGSFTKKQVRELARSLGFESANRPESQDICFIKDGDYAGFIERYTGAPSTAGDFITGDGRVLGRHKGIIHYTIGQRKGLGLSLPAPLYVCEIDGKSGSVILGEESRLFSKSLTAANINLISVSEIKRPIRVKAKVRYRQSEQWATAEQLDENRIHVEFDNAQRALTPGQSVVLYDGDVLVGGGIIE